MDSSNLELIVNPQKQEFYPDRYKAVLLIDGGLYTGYPKGMDWEGILKSASNKARDKKIKITYHEKQ